MALILELSSDVVKATKQDDITRLVFVYSTHFPDLNFVPTHLEIEFLESNEMQTLNKEQRNKDKSTDVLSFPLYPNLASWQQQTVRGNDILLGNIVICPEYAAQMGTPILDLIHHGILHILGFDHETDEEVWRTEERAIVESAQKLGLIIHGIPDSHDTL